MKYFIVGALIACFTVTVASSKDERELKMRIASVLKEKRANRLFRKGTDTITFPVFTDDPLLCCSKARSFFRCHSLSQPPKYLSINAIVASGSKSPDIQIAILLGTYHCL